MDSNGGGGGGGGGGGSQGGHGGGKSGRSRRRNKGRGGGGGGGGRRGTDGTATAKDTAVQPKQRKQPGRGTGEGTASQAAGGTNEDIALHMKQMLGIPVAKTVAPPPQRSRPEEGQPESGSGLKPQNLQPPKSPRSADESLSPDQAHLRMLLMAAASPTSGEPSARTDGSEQGGQGGAGSWGPQAVAPSDCVPHASHAQAAHAQDPQGTQAPRGRTQGGRPTQSGSQPAWGGGDGHPRREGRPANHDVGHGQEELQGQPEGEMPTASLELPWAASGGSIDGHGFNDELSSGLPDSASGPGAPDEPTAGNSNSSGTPTFGAFGGMGFAQPFGPSGHPATHGFPLGGFSVAPGVGARGHPHGFSPMPQAHRMPFGGPYGHPHHHRPPGMMYRAPFGMDPSRIPPGSQGVGGVGMGWGHQGHGPPPRAPGHFPMPGSTGLPNPPGQVIASEVHGRGEGVRAHTSANARDQPQQSASTQAPVATDRDQQMLDMQRQLDLLSLEVSRGRGIGMQPIGAGGLSTPGAAMGLLGTHPQTNSQSQQGPSTIGTPAKPAQSGLLPTPSGMRGRHTHEPTQPGASQGAAASTGHVDGGGSTVGLAPGPVTAAGASTSQSVSEAFRHHAAALTRPTDPISSRILAELAAVMPTADEEQRQAGVIDFLRGVVQRRWPAARVLVYGSSASGFALRGADCDATMVIDPDCPERERYIATAEGWSFDGDEADIPERYRFEYGKATRAKPGQGRHAAKQWLQRKDADAKRRQKKAEEKAAARAEKEAAGLTEDGGGKSPNGEAASKDADDETTAVVKPEEPKKPENLWQQNVIVQLARDLVDADATGVKPLPRARIPVVKFTEPKSGVACDVCLDNVLATRNTALLRTYARVDARVRQLVFAIKFWAKRRKINSTYEGTLSSYAYVILVIFFLQTTSPPVLPNLQKMYPPGTTREQAEECIGEHNVYFCDNLEYIEKQGFGRNTRNTETLGRLLLEFYHFLATGFDYRNKVISIREGRELTKEQKGWTSNKNNFRNRYFWCIEDPFELSHNLGRVADKDSLYLMRGEFMRASKVLYKTGSMQELCTEYQEGTDRKD